MSREKDRSNQIIATGKTVRLFEPNSRKVDQILTEETHRRKEIERKRYAEVLINGTGTIENVDQYEKYEKKEVCAKQKPVCLGDVCSQVLGVELDMELEKERRCSPELCSTAVQTINDSCSPLIEDNISPIQNIDGNKSKSKNNSSSLQEIYSQLLKEDCSQSMADKRSPPRICTNTAQTKNDSSSTLIEENIFHTKDKELLSILEELQSASISEDIDQVDSHLPACSAQDISINHQHPNSSNHSFHNSKTGITNEGRLVGYFCSDTVFNLCKKVLTDTEIRVLEKGLDFAQIQNKINEPELILRIYAGEYVLNGIFGTNLSQHTVKFHRLPQSLPGNLLESILILRYF